MIRISLGCLAGMLLSSTASAASIPSLYWSETGGIVRSGLDGSQVEAITPGFEIGGLAIDRTQDLLFFSDILPLGGPGPAGFIFRGTSVGEHVEPIVRELHAPTAVAIDRTGGQVFWSDREDRTIRIAGYNGTGAETILPFQDSIADINGLAFDPWERKIYFSYVNPLIDSLTPGAIARMNPDGSELETMISGLVAPQGVAVDHVRKRLYWADQVSAESGVIGSDNYGGGDRQEQVNDLHSPRGVAFDPFANQLYWADSGTGKIQTQTPFVTAIDLVKERSAPLAIGLLIHSGVAGDNNDDGQVDLADLNNVRNNFGGAGGGDTDLDGDVDLDDLNAVRNNFGTRFTPPNELAGVPEPSSFALAGGTALLAIAAVSARKSPTSARR
jgi:hypothetical protein